MKRIAILVETSLSSGREILSGISRYLNERPDWSIYLYVGPLDAMEPNSIRNWQGDGIIARIADEKLLETIQAKNLPTVDVLGNIRRSSFPLFKSADLSIGKRIALHFLESGHRNFAFLGLNNERWSVEREEGYKSQIVAKKQTVRSFYIKQRPSDQAVSSDEIESVKTWLNTLPSPVAIMVASDQFAPVLFEACHQLGLAIPENVSIIGVDNDSPYCNLCRPRLSSLQPDHEKVGYLAAKGLATLIDGDETQENLVEVDSAIMNRRASSGLIAIEDPSMLTSLKYIRENAQNSPSLDTIAEAAGISRSVLQRRFRKQFDRTVGDAILHEKLLIAGEMLSNTKLPISEVAVLSGFNCQEYMNHIFKTHLKTTPKRYRLK